MTVGKLYVTVEEGRWFVYLGGEPLGNIDRG